jgi:hypothetical protein
MSMNDEVLKSLKLHSRNAQGKGIDSVVQLPMETVLRIRRLLKIQNSALKSADTLVDTLRNNFDKNNSCVQIDEDTIKINEIIIKSSLV